MESPTPKPSTERLSLADLLLIAELHSRLCRAYADRLHALLVEAKAQRQEINKLRKRCQARIRRNR